MEGDRYDWVALGLESTACAIGAWYLRYIAVFTQVFAFLPFQWQVGHRRTTQRWRAGAKVAAGVQLL